jgi:hypothetical protein
MMKKYLFLLPLMLVCNAMFGQSIKFSDLLAITPMDNDGVYETLHHGSAFKQDYSQDVDGYPMEYFEKINAKPDLERIAVGQYVKVYNGVILRTLDYSSTDVQVILNMVSQAKRYGMDQQFVGADATYNIYLFSNSFFSVNIYVRRDQTAGLVEIKQKDYLQLD